MTAKAERGGAVVDEEKERERERTPRFSQRRHGKKKSGSTERFPPDINNDVDEDKEEEKDPDHDQSSVLSSLSYLPSQSLSTWLSPWMSNSHEVDTS